MYISGVFIGSLHREGHFSMAFFSGGRDVCGDRLGRCQTLQGGDKGAPDAPDFLIPTGFLS